MDKDEATPSSVALATEDEPYNSEEDSDFDTNAPADTVMDEQESASDEDDGEDIARPRKKRRLSAEEDVTNYAEGELDSGDEVTITKAKEKMERRRKKKEKGKQSGKNGAGDEEDFELDEDEAGGEGGFVRTRAMRMKQVEERKPLARVEGATVDVDAIWAQLNAPSAGTMAHKLSGRSTNGDAVVMDGDQARPPTKSTTKLAPSGEEMITIRRTYEFAGEMITEEKRVPKDSAEAKVYLSTLDAKKKNGKDAADDQSKNPKPKLQKPLRRISRFDPNPPDAIKKNWEKLPTAQDSDAAKGPKLNTVMKSKLDWAAYVDKAGIKDDLDVHSKAKEGYMGRMDFLGRVESKQEEERRNLRLKNSGR